MELSYTCQTRRWLSLQWWWVVVFRRPFVKRFALCYRSVVCLVCLSVLSVTFVHFGQTVGRIKMKLGVNPTLKYRRLREIEVFKITHDLYDPDVSLNLAYYSGTITRGNKYKLINHRFRYDLRKYYFSVRVINIWNSLPNHVVDFNSVNVVKARLDRFWMDQDV